MTGDPDRAPAYTHRLRVGNQVLMGRLELREVAADQGNAHPVIVSKDGDIILDPANNVIDICVEPPIPYVVNGEVCVEAVPVDSWLVDRNGVPMAAPTQTATVLAPNFRWVDKELAEGKPHPRWGGPTAP